LLKGVKQSKRLQFQTQGLLFNLEVNRVVKLSNGHSQKSAWQVLALAVCEFGKSGKSAQNVLANVSKSGESAQNGLANVGKSGESAQNGWQMSASLTST
jgi:hypothetical protein